MDELELQFRSNENKWLNYSDFKVCAKRNVIRSMITNLRKQGMHIIQNDKLGWKLTTNKEEIENYRNQQIRKLENQIELYKNW